MHSYRKSGLHLRRHSCNQFRRCLHMHVYSQFMRCQYSHVSVKIVGTCIVFLEAYIRALIDTLWDARKQVPL